jgi:hypothetical protein
LFVRNLVLFVAFFGWKSTPEAFTAVGVRRLDGPGRGRRWLTEEAGQTPVGRSDGREDSDASCHDVEEAR